MIVSVVSCSRLCGCVPGCGQLLGERQGRGDVWRRVLGLGRHSEEEGGRKEGGGGGGGGRGERERGEEKEEEEEERKEEEQDAKKTK